MRIPGLVDLQVNGYRGVDLSGADLAEEEVVRLCRELQQAGTTAFLPTLITSSTDRYRRNLPIIADVMDKPEFQMQMLGIHLEGPFISPHDGARGAHNAEWTRMPDVDYLERLIDWAHEKVKMLTLAADLDGAAELAQYATNRGITVALGHHTANEQQLANLVQAGATALTHLGNGIPAMLPRHDNAIWAGLANDDLSATLIADGHHLPPSLLRTIIRAKGPERCILISDATALAGMPPGEYESMDARVVLEEDGLLHNPATGYLAGSSATLLACANHLASLDLVTTKELVAMVFDNPLKLLGINPGKIRGESEILFDERCRRFLQEQSA